MRRTHQALAVAERHSGRAVLASQGADIVAVVQHVVTPLGPLFAPVLHREMLRHQVGVKRQVQVEVLPVRRQPVEDPGARRVGGGVRQRASPAARPLVLHGVAQEVPVLVHAHRDRQLVVLQVRQEFLFHRNAREEEQKDESVGFFFFTNCLTPYTKTLYLIEKR